MFHLCGNLVHSLRRLSMALRRRFLCSTSRFCSKKAAFIGIICLAGCLVYLMTFRTESSLLIGNLADYSWPLNGSKIIPDIWSSGATHLQQARKSGILIKLGLNNVPWHISDPTTTTTTTTTIATKKRLHTSESKQKTNNSDNRTNLRNKNNAPSSEGGKDITDVTTTMSFDPSHVVSCRETPFVQCSRRPPVARLNDTFPGRVFKVAFLRRPNWLRLGKHELVFDGCAYKGCKYVDNEVDESTDVVILYSVGLSDKFPIPKRWPHQIYVAAAWESPLHTHAGFLSNPNSHWNSHTNLTVTYRADSDIFSPYEKLKFDPIPLESRPNYYEIAKKKTKLVAWLVSNCHPPSQRQQYVREMQKYIDVDIYGGCGSPCKDCLGRIVSEYKFYLAFENSLCTDYVTEKFFKFFKHDTYIITVARSGTNYSKYFPEFTYIDTADFMSPKDLALYLKDLGSDLTRYSKFLEYKDLYQVHQGTIKKMQCYLCEYLHTHTLEPKVSNLKAWMGDGHCFAPNDIKR